MEMAMKMTISDSGISTLSLMIQCYDILFCILQVPWVSPSVVSIESLV